MKVRTIATARTAITRKNLECDSEINKVDNDGDNEKNNQGK